MTWTQANRPFQLTTPLGADVLMLVSWKGEERVSSLSRFTLRAISTRGDISPSQLLLQNISIKVLLPDNKSREIHGVVSRFTLGGRAPVGFFAYIVEMVPKHFELSLNEGFTLFQNKTSRDACTASLAGMTHTWKVSRAFDPRPYCFRYRESHFDFVSRLMEQEGICYRMDHSVAGASMVFMDATSSAPASPLLSAMTYNETPQRLPFLYSFAKESAAFIGKTHLRTASEFVFSTNLEASTASSGQYQPPSALQSYRYEQQLAAHHQGVDHGGGDSPADVAKLSKDATMYSRLRQERQEAEAVIYTGESRYPALEAGCKVTVNSHPNDDLNQSLFVLSVVHEGSNGDYEAGDGAVAEYHNSFRAIPSATPYRPPIKTPWPRVGGTHVGTVVGPSGQEIFTDKFGRVQVVFKWDEDDSKALSNSCWIRVAQPFAGQQFGAVFIPRIGHEVLVDFLDGNPDNPVVVGSLYNSSNMPPWALPDHKTQSGVRTKSTMQGGADNYNELRFEDKKGSEQVWLQAEKNLDTHVKNNETRLVGYDRITTIHNADTKKVEESDDKTIVEKGKQIITIAANDREISVDKNQTVSIGMDHSLSVGQSQTVSISVDETIDIGDNRTTSIGKDDSTSISGAMSLSVGKDRSVTVSGNDSLDVSKAITIKANKDITIESNKTITLKVGSNSITISQKGIEIAGAKIQVKADMMAQVQAAAVEIKGSSATIIKGGTTMIN